jgi:hypothetical protein
MEWRWVAREDVWWALVVWCGSATSGGVRPGPALAAKFFCNWWGISAQLFGFPLLDTRQAITGVAVQSIMRTQMVLWPWPQ